MTAQNFGRVMFSNNLAHICVWDALGVIAMIGHDGTVDTSCPDCGEALSLSVRAGRLDPAEGLVHFTVPAAHWWDDMVFA